MGKKLRGESNSTKFLWIDWAEATRLINLLRRSTHNRFVRSALEGRNEGSCDCPNPSGRGRTGTGRYLVIGHEGPRKRSESPKPVLIKPPSKELINRIRPI